MDKGKNRRKEFEDVRRQGVEAEGGGDFFAAAIYLKKALALARELNDSKEISFLKERVIANSQKIDYKSLTVEQRVPAKEVSKSVDAILGDEKKLEDTLRRVGRHPFLTPNLQKILQKADETMPLTYRFATFSTFSKEGHVPKGGGDPNTSWQAQTYQFSQELICGLYLANIFKKLMNEKGLTADIVLNHLKDSGIFNEASLPIIERGVRAYFDSDHVSAIHILTPQFEHAFLRISGKLGADVTGVGRGEDVSIGYRPLSEQLLDSAPFKEIWGDDFCGQLKFVLCSPLGYRLRHKVAHGEISIAECTSKNSELILFLFLALAGRVSRVSLPK